MHQISLLELLDDIPTSSNKGFKYHSYLRDESIYAYLQKGEKILSLLREKGEKRTFKESTFLECFNFNTYSSKEEIWRKMDYLVSCIRDKMVRPILARDFGEYDFLDRFRSLFGVFSEQLVVQWVEKSSYADRIMASILRKRSNYEAGMIVYPIKNEGDKWYSPLGNKAYLSNSQNGRKWRLRNKKNYIRCVDPGLFYSYNIFYFQLREHVLSILEDVKENELEDNKIYHMLISEQLSIMDKKKVQGVLYVPNNLLSRDYVKDFLTNYNILYKVIGEDEIKRVSFMKVVDFAPLFFLTKDVNPSDWTFELNYKYYSNKTYVMLDGGVNLFFSIKLFEFIFEEYLEDKRTDAYLKETRSEYAKSYQTKKNITKKCLDYMVESEFNQYFGYVEFDYECDLEKIIELEKEFRALAYLFSWKKKEDVSLRFRKLGKHKANGLYYPYLKCLCVDVRHPSSMVHEYFHCIDYDGGELSRKQGFSKVIYLYRKVVTEYMSLNKGNPEYDKFMGNSKYNKDYYFQPSEIFARCGEIYLVRHRKIDNSLVKPKEGFAYPDSVMLMEAIVDYYDELLYKNNSSAYKIASC